MSMSEGTLSGTSVLSSERLIVGGRRDETPAEAALDTEISRGDRVVERRRGLHDLAVLDVQRERAADAAIRADRVGPGLPRFVPRSCRTQIELAARHQRARRT